MSFSVFHERNFIELFLYGFILINGIVFIRVFYFNEQESIALRISNDNIYAACNGMWPACSVLVFDFNTVCGIAQFVNKPRKNKRTRHFFITGDFINYSALHNLIISDFVC